MSWNGNTSPMVYDYPEPPAVTINDRWRKLHADEEDDDVFDYEPYEYASEET